MIYFMRRNWKGLTALTAAAVCIFAPPMPVIVAIWAVASSPFVATLGAYTVPAAFGIVAATAALATYLTTSLVEGVLNVFGFIGKKLFPRNSTKPQPDAGAPMHEASNQIEVLVHEPVAQSANHSRRVMATHATQDHRGKGWSTIRFFPDSSTNTDTSPAASTGLGPINYDETAFAKDAYRF